MVVRKAVRNGHGGGLISESGGMGGERGRGMGVDGRVLVLGGDGANCVSSVSTVISPSSSA